MAQRLATRSDWLAAHPPAPERLTQTLAGVAQRSRSGEDFQRWTAAIALAFDERRSTRDIDAVFEPKGAVYEAAVKVGEDEADLRLLANELGLESAEEVLSIAERTYGDRLDPAARFFVEQIFESG